MIAPTFFRLLIPALAMSLPLRLLAETWYPSVYGPDDTLGAINNLSPAAVVSAAKLVTDGKVYPLGVETGPDSPAYSPRSYSLTVVQPGAGTGQTLGNNRATGNEEILTFWMGIGSQIDGLGHLGENHTYYNGNHADEFVTLTGLTKLSIDKLPPIVGRGVMLDMAGHFGEAFLPAGFVFNSDAIKARADAQGVTIAKGDVVLFHTGWAAMAEKDPGAFMSGEPGLGLEGARYLAELGVIAVGSDSWAVEALPFEDPTLVFPVHVELLTKNGIYILESMVTKDLAAAAASEFLFVLGQPRFEGAVQAIINPIGIR